MDVYVVPVGVDRYELYCEVATDHGISEGPPPSGIVARLRHRVAVMLHAAEERQHRHEPDPNPHEKGLLGRLQERVLAWIVERIAEQRLLWNLRGKAEALAMHPDDMTFDQVQTLVHRMLQRDYDRHKVWLVVDGIAFLISFVVLGPIFLLIPGIANIPALYFGFRVVGHWLSMRGASQGLHRVTWSGRACPPLTDLRRIAVMAPGDRGPHVHHVAERLRLHRFPTFFERVAIAHN
jgi:hypothetical protein